MAARVQFLAARMKSFKLFGAFPSRTYFGFERMKTQRFSSGIESVVNDQNRDIIVLGKSYRTDEMTNITPSILSKLDKRLHNLADHPLKILKDKIHTYLYAAHRTRWGSPVFTMIDDVSPVVSIDQNFDSLLVPVNHIARSRNDNYYINKDILLRAHTTAHERELLKMGLDAWVLTGDVYRRDEIDRTHYPVFHQMEGVRLFVKHELFQNYQDALDIFSDDSEQMVEKQVVHSLEAVKLVEHNLKETLSGLVEHLCDKNVEIRWVDAYFPFTHPSWEMEIKVEDEWMELLGCGILQHDILKN
ncbi:Phenylalanine--tRNA ligase, mitochondrial, partial [Paramuricea clavata]